MTTSSGYRYVCEHCNYDRGVLDRADYSTRCPECGGPYVKVLIKAPSELRKGMPPVPLRMMRLPLDHRGYPVPWFVSWIDDKPDFRVFDKQKLGQAIRAKLCWICGAPLYARASFVLGPMGAINQVSPEPPSHEECAEFAVKVCPFLVLPKAQRRKAGLPDNTQPAAGMPFDQNPKVCLLWTTKSSQYSYFLTPSGEILFDVGEPIETHWYAGGRAAIASVIMDAMSECYWTLEEKASREFMGVTELDRRYQEALKLVPAE